VPSRHVIAVTLISLALLPQCGSPSQPPAEARWPAAAGDLQDPVLATLCVDLWEQLLRDDPVQAGQMGDERFLALLADRSPGGRAQRRQQLESLLERVHLQAQALPASEQDTLEASVTLAMAEHWLQGSLLRLELGMDRWNLRPGYSLATELFNLAPDQPTSTPAQRAALLERWRAMPAYVDRARARLVDGLSEGLVASQSAVETIVLQFDELLSQPVSSWPLAPPGPASGAAVGDAAWRSDVLSVLEQELAPALRAYRDLLAEQILPVARGDDRPGLCWLPGGDRAYRELAADHTGLVELSPEQIHQIGLDEVARIREEIADLGERVLGTRDVAAIQHALRTAPEHRFETRAEVQQAAEVALENARAAIPEWFGRLPETPCEVVRIAAHEERDTTIAYYRQPSADGSTPGRYFINTFAPETRPRFEAEVLAYHESIPGHHLQIAIAQELDGVPLFQRWVGTTAFVEGWALYTERLSDEMGLYSSDMDRFGVLSFDAWRACRLVVDTGLHAFRMTRQDAIDYMLENTLLTADNIVNEVDRYIAWPGQALAYKLGQLEILRLRSEARAALGERFDYPGFHDAVLSSGAVTLGILGQKVRAWVRARQGGDARLPASDGGSAAGGG
jgi:uncharacterized protein (DUF885 family)